MLKETRKFYRKTRLELIRDNPPEGEPPITHIRVFYKEYPRLPAVKLLKREEESEFETLLEMRESRRFFSQEPISFEDLSKVLRSCRIVDVKRSPERRTYPSGGARFPVEMYVLAHNVRGLEEGAYHYNLPKETLELLVKKNLKPLSRVVISPYLENPAVTLVFTSVLSRSEVKYGVRAYPYSLIEAGHMGQNIHLACAEIGIGSCSVSGFVDKVVSDLLDLTEEEIPLYTISFGKPKFIS